MKKQAFQAKTKEDAIKLALESVNANKDEVIIIEKMSKKTLFSKKEEIEVILKEDVNKEIKNYLLNLIKSIDESSNLEIKIR